MDNAICIGCGVLIDTQAASEQDGLCLSCLSVLNSQRWDEAHSGDIDRETRFLERCFVPTVDPYEMGAKLDQLISLTHSLQIELANIHTALKRYETHYRDVHDGS
jgi:hypothetical protein